MKAIAIVVSARQRGNCYDSTEFVLQRLQAAQVETELVNFYDYRVIPCQKCQYECESHDGLPDRLKNVCPIDDDVPIIWQKVWSADILLLFIPTYRGYPPALWTAFLQRRLGLKLPADDWMALQVRMKKAVISAVVFASPGGATGGEWTPAIIAANVRWLKHKVAAFEVINHYSFDQTPAGRVVGEAEVQRRLAILAERTLKVALV